MEAISEVSGATKNSSLLTEHVRARLARQISHSLADEEGYISVLALSSEWEKLFVDSIMQLPNDEKQLSMEPMKIQEFYKICRKKLDEIAMQGVSPSVLVNPMIRPYVRSVIAGFNPGTPVLSQNEIYSRIKLKILGQIS